MQKPELKDFGLTEKETYWAGSVEGRLSLKLGIVSALGWVVVYGVLAVKSFHLGLFLLAVVTGAVFVPIAVTAMLLILPAWGLLWLLSPRYRQAQRYERAVREFSAWWKRTQMQFWRSLSGRQFEAELAALYRRAGFRAELTPSSGDEGVDIWLHTDRGMLIVQCKAHRAPVGPAVARELYGTLQHFRAVGAILASTSGFSTGVVEYVRGKPIELLGLAQIIALQEKHGH